jgi:hypothetical protein
MSHPDTRRALAALAIIHAGAIDSAITEAAASGRSYDDMIRSIEEIEPTFAHIGAREQLVACREAVDMLAKAARPAKRVVVQRSGLPECNTSRLCRIYWRETAKQIRVEIEDTFVDQSRISPLPDGLCVRSCRAYGADDPDWRAWAADAIQVNALMGGSATADAPEALIEWADEVVAGGAP